MKTTKKDDLPRRDEQADSLGAATASTDPTGCAHTPGVWTASQGVDDDDTRWIVQVGPLGWHLATIENGAPGDDLATEGANAHLIAAAPELLDACKDVLSAVSWDRQGYGGFRVVYKLMEQAVLSIQAAIAKAEGRS